MTVWDRAGIELATPGSAVRHTSVARQVTDCAMRPGLSCVLCFLMCFVLGSGVELDCIDSRT